LLHVAPANTRISVSENPTQIANADAVVFPGQGAAKACMNALNHIEGLKESVVNAAQDKPFLGICMGMQVLMSHSAENGGVPCLDLFKGDVLAFADQPNWSPAHKIPQMGWNQVNFMKHEGAAHPVWGEIPNGSYFYFVHSFYAKPHNMADVAGETDYGGGFASAIARDNLFATQFHPEKSANQGLALYRNFLHWQP
jgi:glutamine amidotransferase